MDGAHLGVNAERALRTIVGDAPEPTEDEHRNPDEMRAWLLAAPSVDEFEAYCEAKRERDEEYTGDDYGEAARVTARGILEAFLADPRLAAMPTESEYDWTDYTGDGMPKLLVAGLSEALRERDVRYVSGITGFQWGWAVNAARYCVELPPAPNPAIVEL